MNPTLVRIHRAILAHPALVLEGPERTAFLEETAGLDALVRTVGLDDEALIVCAWALRKLGRFAEAHEAVDRALARGRTWKAATAKASVHRAQGQLDAALALYDEGARLDPADTTAFVEAGRALGEAGRSDEAATWFGRAFARDPDRLDAFAWQEYALFLGDRDPARAERVRAIADRARHLPEVAYLLSWME